MLNGTVLLMSTSRDPEQTVNETGTETAQQPESTEDPKEAYRREFADDFAHLWEMTGSPRMIGRVLGYLLIMDRPYISSADLAAALKVSSGAISMATQRLLETGFIRKHSLPGDRKRYYVAEEDPWGSFLANERRYFDHEIRVIDRALGWIDASEEQARQRLRNGRDYMEWVQAYHHRMRRDWEEYKRARDAGETPPWPSDEGES